jgi:hypothetical protein
MSEAIKAEPELPIPHYPSRRLVGLEVELDAVSAAFHQPQIPQGWEEKGDLSLQNGREYILEPPQPIVEAKTAIEAFSDAVTKAKMHVCKTGGLHIHVQVHDITTDDATRLCQIYWRYQDCIDLLVGPSRRTKPTPNTNCTPFLTKPSRDYLERVFQLNLPAPNRMEAKKSRQKHGVNLAMMRCSNPLHRSIEFRQPSPSKHLVNLYGWACFTVALVEFARIDEHNANNGKREKTIEKYIKAKGNWRNFLALCKRMEIDAGADKLLAWVKWRRDYLNSLPSSEKIQKLYRCLLGKAHGIHYIARKLNINLAVARKLIDSEVSKGRLIEEVPLKYRVQYESVAPLDLKAIIKVWQARERPAQVINVPRSQSSNPAPVAPPAEPVPA